jgi:CYTH domain-containing protein
VAVSLKYAVVERERRFLLGSLPTGGGDRKEIVDRYITGTRMRLREVRSSDGSVVRKLGHKVRLDTGPAQIACTNFYLDQQEWDVLIDLPARVLRKTRHVVRRDGVTVAIDELEDGTLLAEIDDGDHPSGLVPAWLDVVEEVSDDERWTGASLAR